MVLCTELLKPDESVRSVAEKLGTLENIYYFVRNRIEYIDEPIDKWNKPSKTLERGCGDCDDMALLLASMLLSVGYDAWVRIATIKTDNSIMDHAYVIVRVGIDWIELDPACKNCKPGERPFTVVEPIMDFTTDLIRIHNPEKAEKYIIR